MRSFETRPVARGDVDHLLEHMRQADQGECAAALGDDWRTLVREGIPRSTMLLAGLYGGEFGSLFGVSPTDHPRVGNPWLLGTDVVDQHPGAALQSGLIWVPRMLEQFPQLVNYVDARNERSIRWLDRIGFTIEPPHAYGYEGRPFHQFHTRHG